METTNKNEEKIEKMTLKDYYDGLPSRVCPKTEFVGKIMYLTGRSNMTVRNWILGYTIPENQNDKKILSEVTGIPVEDLW